jgi:iron complex transport system substrate-binding protein
VRGLRSWSRPVRTKVAYGSCARKYVFPPRRIVSLTEETVETLYLLGEQERIVGISGYVVRPPQARREKPRVSAFTSANIDKILALKPDLVQAFSDLQANIVADLIRRGLNVHAFNQRSVAGILDMIRMLGAMVDASERAQQLIDALEARLAEAQSRAECLPRRPREFFEEWGRSAHLRDRLGLRARRDRRRHRHLRRS